MSPQEFRCAITTANRQAARILYSHHFLVIMVIVRSGRLRDNVINSSGGFGADSFVRRYPTLRCILHQCTLGGNITRVLQVHAMQASSGDQLEWHTAEAWPRWP